MAWTSSKGRGGKGTNGEGELLEEGLADESLKMVRDMNPDSSDGAKEGDGRKGKGGEKGRRREKRMMTVGVETIRLSSLVVSPPLSRADLRPRSQISGKRENSYSLL